MESQYAYQRGRSTKTALHDLVQKIERSLNQKALVLFLDIDGAFDNASFGSMDAASGEHGVDAMFAVKALELRSGEAVSGYS
jgi:hypothetical protein